MNPSLAAVSAFGLRAPETFETAISAGARHMASERLARDMQGYRWLDRCEWHVASGSAERCVADRYQRLPNELEG